MTKTAVERHESLAPQVHRRLRRRRRRPRARHARCRSASARPRPSARRRRRRGQRLGRRQARRHLRHPHRALGDGAGHAHRPRPARRRGARVRLEARSTTESITPGQNLARKRVWGEMGTGGSRGIRTSQDYVRRGGAAARMMLLQAAADQWKVPVGELTRGQRRHHARGRRAHDDATARSRRRRPSCTPPDPKSIKLKDPKDWKIAGKPMKRLDTADKLNGSKVYAIDVKLPGMLCAAIKECPVFGGKLVSFDEAKIAGRARRHAASVKVNDYDGRRRRRHVVAREDGARRAADRLGRGRRRDAVERDDRRAPEGRPDGDGRVRDPQRRRRARRRSQGAAKKVEAVYSTPFLAHATMEPMNCTVRITADRAEVLGADAERARRRSRRCPRQSGLPLDKCEVYKHDLGGGFGRRGGAQDYVRQAVAHRQAVPRRPGQDDLEPRRGHGARLLPADLAVQAGRGPRRQGQSRRRCTCACRASRSTRSSNPARSPGRQGRPPAAGLLREARRRAARLHRAEPADRVRDAQHARAGRALARRQHQPERRLHGMLHRRGGAGGRQGPARVPPRADGQASEASRRAQRGGGEGATGASRCRPACIAASRSSWATAATRRRSPRCR